MPLGLSKNLFQRVVSALTLLPIVLGAVYLGGWYFIAFLALGGVLMATEWSTLTLGKRDYQLIVILLAITVFEYFMIGDGSFQLAPALLTLLAVSLVGIGLVKFSGPTNFGWLLIGVGYVGLPLVSLWWLRALDDGSLVTWVLFVVFATDVGGYVAGKNIGGPKLAPKLSPKKTWSGLLGGMVLSAAIGAAFHFGLSVMSSVGLVLVVSDLLAVWAQVGDLAESGVKRHFGVKDSGALIPGHGGLLDRVDGLVFVAPAVAVLILLYASWFTVAVV
ncbi:MAG: phosphatidate cytidylyltransferase [Kordiimonadales bacterium]|nr:MAG: phosphatidate cytidylyltransferase [Kordiimonadales bacterium]